MCNNDIHSVTWVTEFVLKKYSSLVFLDSTCSYVVYYFLVIEYCRILNFLEFISFDTKVSLMKIREYMKININGRLSK